MKTPISAYSQTQLHSFIPNCSTSSSNPSNIGEVGNKQSLKAHYCSSLPFLPHTFPLLQCEVPLMHKVLQELLQHGVVFTILHGPQFLLESLLHYGLFADCLFPQNLSIYSSVESSIGCSVDTCSDTVLGLQGATCFTIVFSMSCKRLSTPHLKNLIPFLLH